MADQSNAASYEPTQVERLARDIYDLMKSDVRTEAARTDCDSELLYEDVFRIMLIDMYAHKNSPETITGIVQEMHGLWTKARV
jgi:hypothetical protein